jgi:hypothetical protein
MLTGGMGTCAEEWGAQPSPQIFEKREENKPNISTNNYSSILNTVGLSVKRVLNGLKVSL